MNQVSDSAAAPTAAPTPATAAVAAPDKPAAPEARLQSCCFF